MMDTIKSMNSSQNDDKMSHLSDVSMTYCGVRGAVKRFGKRSGAEIARTNPRPQRHFRWRMLSRVIVSFVRWEKLKSSGKDKGFVMRRIVAGRVQERVFNVAQFSKHVQQHQLLNVHAKLLLYKEPQLRSNQDLVVILGYMNRMQCFNKYSVFTKRQLASKIRYNCFPENTVIFREGAHPTYFYFLLSGSVQLYKTETVALSEESENGLEEASQKVLRSHGKPITEGAGFGDLSIAYSDTRNFTIKTREPSECFTLESEDYIELLGSYHDEERTMKSNVIRKIPQVAKVPEADIKKAIDSCYIKNFTKGDLIIRGEDFYLDHQNSSDPSTTHLDTYAHVVVSGSAVLEKRICVNQEPLPGGTTIVKLPDNLMENKALEAVTQKVRARATMGQPLEGLLTLPPLPPEFPTFKYLSVQTYVSGDIFLPFIHEKDYVIGAKEATTILYVPKTPFMLHKSGEMMAKLFDELLNSKISVDEQLKEYNSRRIWKDYRKQMVRQVLVDKLLRKSRC